MDSLCSFSRKGLFTEMDFLIPVVLPWWKVLYTEYFFSLVYTYMYHLFGLAIRWAQLDNKRKSPIFLHKTFSFLTCSKSFWLHLFFFSRLIHYLTGSCRKKKEVVLAPIPFSTKEKEICETEETFYSCKLNPSVMSSAYDDGNVFALVHLVSRQVRRGNSLCSFSFD